MSNSIGSFGIVYKAKERITKAIRAIKAINVNDLDSVDQFKNEVEILTKLDHPNIVKLYEIIYDSHYIYLVEEYCYGGDLLEYIKNQRHFSEKKAATILKQLLHAISYLHSLNLVHRDIKPENIVFIETNKKDINIKLIDFGTCISVKKDETIKQELGTVTILIN